MATEAETKPRATGPRPDPKRPKPAPPAASWRAWTDRVRFTITRPR
jgi:hypothetical protein